MDPNLTIRSVDFGVKLTIFAEEAKRYLCFNKNWKLVGSKRLKGPMCQFYEDMVDNGYNRYRSAANESYFVGFNRKGRPLKAAEIVPRSRSNTPRRHKPHIRAKCLNFLKRGSDFSIGKHNDRMGGNRNPSFLPLVPGHERLRPGLIAGPARGSSFTLGHGIIAGVGLDRFPEKREKRLGKEDNLRKRHGSKGKRKWDGS
ncbi:hypothetical protein J437_LFUL001472 [Ladona fulva]|uniref:Fibroblast growth factor 17 n=1 Tax=Ladona fulva TaxID=123851 RepID=A0A8K0NWH3_LADFU|nr:hypothetical protein J437_LFUL001472 [Ladona fulva]